jgi:hypothetical protein
VHPLRRRIVNETIKAAWISGSLQASSAIAAIIAAWIALSSWRRHALGTRQIELAEECLQAVWTLDEEIADARRLLFPGDIETIKGDAKIRDYYVQNYQKAFAAVRECLAKQKALRKLFMLSELYLGVFPRVEFSGTTRFFGKMPYTIYGEYEEIISQLLSDLFKVSPNTIVCNDISAEWKETFDKSANLFHGFMYEYEEDEYSIRLRLTKNTFERHIKNVLRRRGMFERMLGRLENWISDRYHRQFRPATINKLPYSSYLPKPPAASHYFKDDE